MLRPRDIEPAITVFPARTPTLPPATHTNSYALGSRDVLLVEPATPFEDEQRAWIEWGRGLASAGRRPVAIAVTHDHPDHIGGIDVLSRELGLPVWAHAKVAERLGSFTIDRSIADGDRIVLEGPETQSWRVLHTPGHSPGHVSFFEEGSRAVVVGDMVATIGTILIAPGEGDMRVYLEQLERLAQLDASVALPAHGDPIASPTNHFRRYIEHRRMRERKVLHAVDAAGPSGATAEALVPGAYDDTPEHLWPLALLSLRAHLEKLVYDGGVREVDGRFVRGR
jgi:glyoxylase-like metal-dependent hydrolase (beta-lactamase superfamily II)